MAINICILTGRLTADPELRYTQDNTAIASFSVAIDRGKNKNGEDLGADFPRVQCFGKTAENVEKYSGKGLRVAVEGSIRTGSYTNKKSEKVYTTDINAQRIYFIDWKEKGSQNELLMPKKSDNFSVPLGFEATEDDDLPY